MPTAPSTIIKPLTFQESRGSLSGDDLYDEMGLRFIFAPNRYRKLVGKTPYEMPISDVAVHRVVQAVDEVLTEDLTATWNDIEDQYMEKDLLACPTMSFGIRMCFLNQKEILRIQAEANKMMQEDWPEYAHLIVGYEPHINLFDEVLIWKKE